MSDQTNAVQGGIETRNHISSLYLFLFFNFIFFQLSSDITAVVILCIEIFINLFPPYLYILIDKTSVQSGSVVAGYGLS